MVAVGSDISAQILELSDDSFNTFCSDITAMLDVEMHCTRQEVVAGTAGELSKHFKKLAAVDIVKASGALNGTFFLLFDRRGLFTLPGVIVMLPASRIIEEIRRGTEKDAQGVQDAMGEAGNLLVGSWGRVFREGMVGHNHFSKTGTFIGDPWDQPQQKIGLAPDEQLLFAIYEMTASVYPCFTCGVAFPKTMLSAGSEPVKEEIKPAVRSEMAQPPTKAGEQSGPSPVKTEPFTVPVEQSSTPAQENKETQVEASDTVVHDESVAKADVPGVVSDTETPLQPVKAQVQKDAWKVMSKPVTEIMRKDVIWALPDDSIGSVFAKMQQHNSGYVIVGSGGVPEGIVSNSNISGAISPYLHPSFSKWRRPLDDASLNIKVKWIMSRPVRTIQADATIAAAIEHIRQFGGRCLPVVDARGVVQGLITMFDIIFAVFSGDSDPLQQRKTPQAPILFI